MQVTDRIVECEYEVLDPSAGNCHGQASHILRDAGLVVCASHVDGADAILKDQREYAAGIDHGKQEIKINEPDTDESVPLSVTETSSAPAGDGAGVVPPAEGISGPEASGLFDKTY